jgi:large subunit ribosomal protein L15
MKFNELSISSNKSARRVGRGIAAGQGKTAGRGTKGQNSRKSGGVRPGFEGGQNPLLQRLPKLPGFRSIRPKAENVFTGQLATVSGTTVNNYTLAEAGLVSSPHVRVKIITKGEVTKKLTVQTQGASKTAIAAIQKAGGTFKVVTREGRTAKKAEPAVK